MDKKIFEYAATDLFILLYLTADGNHLDDTEALHQIDRSQYDPDLVAEIEKTPLGVPSSMTVHGMSFNVDDEGMLDGSARRTPRYSFQARGFKLFWTIEDENTGRQIKHREDGPALVKLDDFKTCHLDGQQNGFELGGWEFAWYRNGVMKRDAGPYAISGSQVEGRIDRNGSYRTVKPIEATFSWVHPSGGNLSSQAVARAENESNIKMNRLSLGHSVFENEMEELIFYATV